MRKQGGFTLVEMMVVVSISLLLMMWGIPAFSTWKTKHDIEGQMAVLYGDLQSARMTAYSRKVVSGVWWGGGTSMTSYQIRSDGNNNGQIDDALGAGGDTQLGATMVLKYAVTPSVNQQSVSFDGRGFLDPNNPITFKVSSTHGSAVDCVAVSSTRIILGKMNGSACNPK